MRRDMLIVQMSPLFHARQHCGQRSQVKRQASRSSESRRVKARTTCPYLGTCESGLTIASYVSRGLLAGLCKLWLGVISSSRWRQDSGGLRCIYASDINYRSPIDATSPSHSHHECTESNIVNAHRNPLSLLDRWRLRAKSVDADWALGT